MATSVPSLGILQTTEARRDGRREVGSGMTVTTGAQARSDETLRRNNEDGSAPSHSTLAPESGRPQSVNKLIDWVSVALSHCCSSPQTPIIYRNTADK